MRKTHKKVYSTKIFFIKVKVEQDASSLKKNVSATNFYETVKATISKSSLGACFSIAIFLWNVEISHFLLKTFADIKLNMWNEREWFIWTYMHILKTLRCLKIPGEKQPLWEARWISATILKMVFLKVTLERCC